MEKALDILDVIDGIVDDTHPEGDGCPLCVALDDLRAALVEVGSEPSPEAHQPGDHHRYRIECRDCGLEGVVQLSVEPQRAAALEDEP